MNNVQILQLSENQRKVVLNARNIECGKLSKEEFVKLLSEDLKIASDNYYEIIAEEVAKSKEREINYYSEKYTKEAEKRYKRKSNQERYFNELFEKEMNRINRQYNSENRNNSFEIDVEFGKMGRDSRTIIDISDLESNLNDCFEYIKENNFWINANGWSIEYVMSNKSLINSWRITIKLILPEELENEAKRLNKELADSVNRFYSNSNYWGD
jgi:Ni,Fe-hydrogenase maturation factor